MMSRRLIPATALLAVVALLVAQVLLASHEIEHLGHPHEPVCEVCLAGAGLGSPLASSAPRLGPLAATWLIRLPLADRADAPSFYRPQLARAPPTLVRP
jgi:hypothetical protein